MGRESATERMSSRQVGLLASASRAGVGCKWLVCKHPQGTQVFSPGVRVPPSLPRGKRRDQNRRGAAKPKHPEEMT